MSIESEFDKIPSLANVGKAIVAFARTLIPGDFAYEGDQWVYRNDNYVTIRIQYARAQSLVFSCEATRTNLRLIRLSKLRPVKMDTVVARLILRDS